VVSNKIMFGQSDSDLLLKVLTQNVLELEVILP